MDIGKPLREFDVEWEEQELEKVLPLKEEPVPV